MSQGSNNTSSQSLSQWPTSNHDSQTDCQKQESKTAQQQDQPSSGVELKQHGSLAEQLHHVTSQDINNPHLFKLLQTHDMPTREHTWNWEAMR